jgi:hypothetical protein
MHEWRAGSAGPMTEEELAAANLPLIPEGQEILEVVETCSM